MSQQAPGKRDHSLLGLGEELAEGCRRGVGEDWSAVVIAV